MPSILSFSQSLPFMVIDQEFVLNKINENISPGWNKDPCRFFVTFWQHLLYISSWTLLWMQPLYRISLSNVPLEKLSILSKSERNVRNTSHFFHKWIWQSFCKIDSYLIACFLQSAMRTVQLRSLQLQIERCSSAPTIVGCYQSATWNRWWSMSWNTNIFQRTWWKYFSSTLGKLTSPLRIGHFH